ncbi:MAG TPA: hypothetical protein VGK48_06165 [Terriglobia bacterium]
MRLISSLLLACSLVLWAPAAAHGQRTGFSIGMPSSAPSSGASGSAQAHAPAMPPLPGPLPSVSTNSAGQMKSLNLSSTHLTPPAVNLFAPAVAGRPGILPQVPYAMDPIAGRSTISIALDKPGMCAQRP